MFNFLGKKYTMLSVVTGSTESNKLFKEVGIIWIVEAVAGKICQGSTYVPLPPIFHSISKKLISRTWNIYFNFRTSGIRGISQPPWLRKAVNINKWAIMTLCRGLSHRHVHFDDGKFIIVQAIGFFNTLETIGTPWHASDTLPYNSIQWYMKNGKIGLSVHGKLIQDTYTYYYLFIFWGPGNPLDISLRELIFYLINSNATGTRWADDH